MSTIISEEWRRRINDPSSVKAVSSINAEGELHVVYKQTLHVLKDGTLELYEIIESSQNNKNFVNAIWFDRPVAINILTTDGHSLEIKGKVTRAHVAGAYFEKVYADLIGEGYYDLSTIWQIKPLLAEEKTLAKRAEEEEQAHPHFRHLDRLLK